MKKEAPQEVMDWVRNEITPGENGQCWRIGFEADEAVVLHIDFLRRRFDIELRISRGELRRRVEDPNSLYNAIPSGKVLRKVLDEGWWTSMRKVA